MVFLVEELKKVEGIVLVSRNCPWRKLGMANYHQCSLPNKMAQIILPEDLYIGGVVVATVDIQLLD